ncbi:ATP-binding protein [Clostridium fallax]|uniref:Two-component system, CitB family, sensor kinase n=1 Tax=Clostridium fallax TaxID=1533 RepID=A0A1M4W4R1_9CLOT|nr:sensor histidine kinase [Clostridium fallax]SHE75942.1 two-component system, CitB family, sensor kinase [Clostridium fallax]SQB22868.1 sensor histidine kinase MalK [Clostridium fallax]
MKLQCKIMLFITVLITLVIFTTSYFTVEGTRTNIEDQIKRNVTNTATMVAALDFIKENVGQPDKVNAVANYVERLRLKTSVHFITVLDMEGTRYSHPLPTQVGLKFTGMDEKAVLRYGGTYTSEANGTLGKSLRAFTPIFKDGEQVGAVCVGVLKGNIKDEFYLFLRKISPYIIFAFIIGVIGAILLSLNIKKTIFGLEPKEIAMVLKERDALINNIYEGVVAVNNQGKISLINEKAKEILKFFNNDNIDEEIINTGIFKSLKEVIKYKVNYVNVEQKLYNGVTIIANYTPLINDEGNNIGAVVTFKDITEVNKMAEELTGIKKLNWDLRAQNHEFMNKLHTIAGLIQLEEYNEALDYIFNTFKVREEVVVTLEYIKDAPLAALLLAKYNKAEESKIEMIIDEECNLESLPRGITSHDMVCILGNLIENSIDELIGRTDGYIFVSIKQEEKLKILVENNGKKIDEELKEKIFNRGFSTKKGVRGFGLYNIKELVEAVGGKIYITSNDEITKWFVEFI